jgi:hypothetical protein
VPKETVEVLRDTAELVAEPALGVVGIREDRGRRCGEDRRGLVMDVEDGRGGEPTALGEDEVRRYLQATPLFPLDVCCQVHAHNSLIFP